MKQILLFSFFLLTLHPSLKAQPKVYDGTPKDSLVFSLELTDSIKHWKNSYRWAEIDTSNTTLWDIGTTSKAFFSSGTGNTRAIMTDTANTYPINANDAFVLSFKSGWNNILTFTHKYETTAGHDGGIVEFSKDNGATWENVKGDCNTDPMGGQGVLTQNFYGTTDTLNDGQMAFSGTSSGWHTSRLQFFFGFPIKTTGTGGYQCVSMDTIYIRFRFVSDDTLESKDGWIIDGLKVEYDDYGGYVNDLGSEALTIYPNPTSGLINFPTLQNANRYTIEIRNTIGQPVIQSQYKREVDLGTQPKGLYFYKVTNGEVQYTGRLVLQ